MTNYTLFDNIAAPATPLQNSAIAVIRLSGPEVISIVSKSFHPHSAKKNLNSQKGYRIVYGKFRFEDKTIDDVMVSVFHEPRSYTGENMVEIYCHGSTYVVSKLMETLLADVRYAQPGEFTKRAFLNNKIDLTQAEAINDLINSKTEKTHMLAQAQYEGSLLGKISELLKELTDIRINFELDIDFTEEEVTELHLPDLLTRLSGFRKKLELLINTGKDGRIVRDGLKVSITGPPNVGKSSIFNAFLETERAIVTPTPGTTRDYIEEAVSIKGYLIRLYDTAGIRRTSNTVEQIGIERSHSIIEKSDLVLYVTDNPQLAEDINYRTKKADQCVKYILHKSDLYPKSTINRCRDSGFIITSVKIPDGLQEIKQALIDFINIRESDVESGVLTNSRHLSAVKKSLAAVTHALESISCGLGSEFTAFDLKQASSYLEEIIGKISTDDILNNIFDNFCIGK